MAVWLIRLAVFFLCKNHCSLVKMNLNGKGHFIFNSRLMCLFHHFYRITHQVILLTHQVLLHLQFLQHSRLCSLCASQNCCLNEFKTPKHCIHSTTKHIHIVPYWLKCSIKCFVYFDINLQLFCCCFFISKNPKITELPVKCFQCDLF